jgi:uncharacterized RDD family membrane protein YckC
VITKAPFTSERREALLRLKPSLPVVPGLASRLAAFLVDIFVMSLACLFSTQAIALTAEFFRLGAFPIGQRLVAIASRVTIVLIIALYLPLSWTLTGQSIGKAILGLRVVRVRREGTTTKLSLPRSMLRFLGYWLSAFPLGFGFLWGLFDAEHRTLHDRLAGTRVVYRSLTSR